MAQSAFENKAALREGWAQTKRHFPSFALLVLVSILLSVLSNAFGQGFFGSLWRFLIDLVQVAVWMVWVRFALSAEEGRAPDPAEIRPTLSSYVEFLLGSIAYWVIVTIGLVLLVVPGVIWAVRFGLFPFFIIDQKMDTLAALKRSYSTVRGITGQLLVFALIVFGLNLLGAICFGIGLFVSMPVTAIAAAYVYRKVRGRAGAPIVIPPATPVPPATPQPSQTTARHAKQTITAVPEYSVRVAIPLRPLGARRRRESI